MKRISIGSWAYAIGPYEDKPIPWDEVVSTLKSLNFQGVELGAFGEHPNPDNYPDKESREKLVKQVNDAGMAFSGLVPNLWGEQLINTDDTSKYKAEFSRAVQFAKDIGTAGIRVDCVQPPTILDEVDEATARKRVVDTWKECTKEAADNGCYVTWEFEPGFAFNKPSDVFRILDEIQDDAFGVEFDTCHAEMVAAKGARHYGEAEILPGGALEMAQRCRGRINHIHLIDSDGTLHGDETSTHAPFGDGYLNFDELVPELLKNELSHDWWTIDLCFWPDAWTVTEKCKTAIDELNKKYG